MGNRGRLHNGQKEVTRQYKGTRWITCSLNHKGIHRDVMSDNSYTELFFLDEATAFAAGHRPCGQCQRDRLKAFQACWLEANRYRENIDNGNLGQIDKVIHRERTKRISKSRYKASPAHLPNGAFVEIDSTAHLVWGGDLSPEIKTMTPMRFPINLTGWRSHNEETLHRRTDYQGHQRA